ncbi:galactose mutarotase-like enzyme [Hydrogenispora ethanolica]|jgi:galactose mutarotase-like enzyme|uniref:Galactose mutarotase-like enzyme n=1 Tax=Hydrogenispora ethanolica TaxID=1082276 RepID=A0A4R1RN99_HYDET|nr:aldose 1-epimerase family protein [Hydrogenispora ethanolica]TCL67380.1 galactose mutarotase-like enzyme [Hydrogenispora ethanolica]
MQNTIQNQSLKITVKSMGAELSSLRTAADDFEYLWQPDPQYWSRQSPLLFPIVGRVEDDRYVLDGREYPLENHGFAKDSLFELIEERADRLVYQLRSDERTLEKYPYHFQLQVSYRLDGSELIIGYAVKNTDARTLWFSIGAHPAFRCPLGPEETMNDYRLEFAEPERVERHFLKNNLFTGATALCLDGEKTLPLSYELFQDGALVFKDLRSKRVTLRSDRNPRSISVAFEGFPFLGIWSPPGPFVCIEPWYGVHGTKDAGLSFQEKEGIRSLAAGATFACEYRISVK